MQKSWSMKSQVEISYNVVECNNLFEAENDVLFNCLKEFNASRALVFIDSNVEKYFGDKIKKYFFDKNIAVTMQCLDVSEENKNIHITVEIIEAMIGFGILRRSEPLIGIGGGVLLDMIGFAASTYRRGIPYIRIPTTLIGIIDAGIGVKTGINYKNHKNRVGTYFAPANVFLDKSFLTTVDKRHLSNGLSEILKMALIKDYHLFSLLEKYGEKLVVDRIQGNGDYDKIIHLAVEGMLEELEFNFLETKLERIVDYGHSFSPQIEMEALPNLLHGEAVAIDMALTILVSERRGLMNTLEKNRVLSLFEKLNLPIFHEVCTRQLFIDSLNDVVKHRDGSQRIPLMNGIGSAVFVNDITVEEMEKAAESILQFLKESQIKEIA